MVKPAGPRIAKRPSKTWSYGKGNAWRVSATFRDIDPSGKALRIHLWVHAEAQQYVGAQREFCQGRAAAASTASEAARHARTLHGRAVSARRSRAPSAPYTISKQIGRSSCRERA